MIQRESSPLQLSLGVAVGCLLAFTPLFTLQWVLIVLTIIVVRMNFATLTISFAFFFALAKIMAPILDYIGVTILTKTPSLRTLLTFLFHAPIIPFTYFYNSLVLGSLILGILIAIPMFFGSNIFFKKKRQFLANKIRDSLMWKRYTTSRVYRRNVR
jgi:uncharacterized protein (TIGR03546 family)